MTMTKLSMSCHSVSRTRSLVNRAASAAKRLTPHATLVAVFMTLGIVHNSEASELRQCKAVYDMNHKQIETLVYAYRAGQTEGFGHTLAAIAWRESLAGEVLINHADPSFGVFHANIRSASVRAGAESTFRQNIIAQRLIDDFDYAAWHALQELKYWQSQYGNNWNKIWASYNGGWNWKGAAAQNYARDIQNKIQQLRSCLLVG